MPDTGKTPPPPRPSKPQQPSEKRVHPRPEPKKPLFDDWAMI